MINVKQISFNPHRLDFKQCNIKDDLALVYEVPHGNVFGTTPKLISQLEISLFMSDTDTRLEELCCFEITRNRETGVLPRGEGAPGSREVRGAQGVGGLQCCRQGKTQKKSCQSIFFSHSTHSSIILMTQKSSTKQIASHHYFPYLKVELYYCIVTNT